MMSKVRSHTKDDAVSPVVGVMLMLVVTVIIAAMVVAFSGGLAEDVEKAPSAVLDVQYYPMLSVNHGGMPYNSPSFRIYYLVGDTNLDTAKMTIVSSWIGTDGKHYSNTFSGSTYAEKGFVYTDDWGFEWTPFMLRNTENQYSNNVPAESWGKCVLSPGDTMITNVNMAAYAAMGYGGDLACGVDKILGANYKTIVKGTEIDVTITYDDHILFDNEVIAQ